jgi:DNA-binding response OmpR family regulator
LDDSFIRKNKRNFNFVNFDEDMNFNDKINILWADDEIDLLKPHIMFLENKGYNIITANNGLSALNLVSTSNFDLIFLDENMPGLSGLETLIKIKNDKPNLPVVMITKSEEESIMENAIGSKISDYLIKPVNPKQILLSIKKNIDNKRLISEKTNLGYQQEFRQIGMQLMGELTFNDWSDIFKKITYWELELEKSGDENMLQILEMQKSEANTQFFKFIKREYKNWLCGLTESPLMSHQIFKNVVSPHLNSESALYMVVIDNLRFDQWKMIEEDIANYFSVVNEDIYLSILPTATQYSRNAIFSGLLPSEMEKIFPDWWKNDVDEGGKNNF